MEDDDLFLVIVENENGEAGTFPNPIITKQEPLDETESKLAIEVMIETAGKHGQFIDLEHESERNEYKYEYLEEEELPEVKPDINLLEESTFVKEEYILPIESEKEQLPGKIRRAMLKPEEQNSFVADLKDQYPELKKDRKLLVDTLCLIMRNVKPPSLPNNHYVQVDDGFECTKCGSTSESIASAGRHYRWKHGPRYLMCYACGVDFRSATNLYKHEKRCKAPDARIVLQARAISIGSKARSRPYLHLRRSAPVAHRMFPNTLGASGPRRDANAMLKYDCTLCSASFITKSNLISHEHLHKGERPYQCHVCPAAYTSNCGLLRHLKKHSNVEYVCDHCGRAFKVKAALVAHMDTHRPQRKFGCDECGRRYAQRAALKLHVDRVHRNLPPPCACEICPKRFTRMSLLKTHMKDEHGLVIMTRKMFFKKLPMLSSSEVKQAAKLVFRTDSKLNRNDTDDEEDPADGHQEAELIVPDNVSSEDFADFLKRCQ